MKQMRQLVQKKRGANPQLCFLFFPNLLVLTLILHFPHTGTQISCFAPIAFSLRQAAYADSFCWAAVQQQADSSPLWLHKVQALRISCYSIAAVKSTFIKKGACDGCMYYAGYSLGKMQKCEV